MESVTLHDICGTCRHRENEVCWNPTSDQYGEAMFDHQYCDQWTHRLPRERDMIKFIRKHFEKQTHLKFVGARPVTEQIIEGINEYVSTGKMLERIELNPKAWLMLRRELMHTVYGRGWWRQKECDAVKEAFDLDKTITFHGVDIVCQR